MLGVRIPAWPAALGPGRVPVGARAALADVHRAGDWGEIGYGLLRLPVSAVAATLSVAAWAAGLVMLTLPLYNRSLPSGGAELGDTVLRGTPHDDGLGGDRPAGAAGRAAADPRAARPRTRRCPAACSVRRATWPPG